MLSNENQIFGTGNGLKNRVTACRRRIRLNRSHRTRVDIQLGEQLLESAIVAPEFQAFLRDEPRITRPLIHAPIIHAPDRESLQPVAEQEVGIT